MSWPLYLALKQLFPKGRRVSFFFVISVLGVALGVMILVIVQSVMGGFGANIRDRLVKTNGHIRIESPILLSNYGALQQRLQEDPRVEAADPYAFGVVMLEYRRRPVFPSVWGYDPEQENQVVPIEDFLVSGDMEALDDESVFLSSGLAAKVGARVGDTVEIYTPLMLNKLEDDELLLPVELEVAGVFSTDWYEFDESTMLVTLWRMQDLYGLKDRVHGVQARLKPGNDAEEVAQDWNEWLDPPQRAIPYTETFQDYLWVLELEKTVMLFLLLFIVIVAAFAIAVAQLLTVVRKTREIGLLGALGGRQSQLVKLYCFQGFFIGALGTGLGILLAWLGLMWRNEIIWGLTGIFGGRDALVKYYQFANLPVTYSLQDFVVIILSALVLATLAGLVPAYRAARMKPADALRTE